MAAVHEAFAQIIKALVVGRATLMSRSVGSRGAAPAMEQGSSSLRLAAAASAFSEWLAQSPFASEVTTDRLLALMRGVPAIYGADARPAKLEAMIRQAKSISGR